MPAKDLGTKFTCFKCGTKFYDLKKPDPVCPKCGADQRQSPALKPTSRRTKEKEPVLPTPEPEAEAAEDEDLADDDAAAGGDDEAEDEEPEDDDI